MGNYDGDDRREKRGIGSNEDTRMILDALSALTHTLQATQKLGNTPLSHAPSYQSPRKEVSIVERVGVFVAPIAMVLGVYMTMHDDILIQKRNTLQIHKDIDMLKQTKKDHASECRALRDKIRNLESDISNLVVSQSNLYKMIQGKQK
jgi:hypothetical protein